MILSVKSYWDLFWDKTIDNYWEFTK